MKTILYSAIGFMLLTSPGIFAQEDAYVHAGMSNRKWTVTSIGTSISTVSFIDRYATLEYYTSRNGTKSKMLATDFSDYNSGQFYFNYQNKFSLEINGFPFKNTDIKETSWKEIRTNLTYSSGEFHGLSFYKHTYTFGDTVTYNGQTLNADTVRTAYFRFFEKTDEISIRSSFIVSTPPNKRIHFSGGGGLEIGGSFIYTGFNGTHGTSQYVLYKDRIGNTVGNNDLGNTSSTETFSIKPYYHASLCFPASIDFRLSKKNELMKHFYLYLKGTYGLGFVFENGTHHARVLYSLGCGIRYRVFTL